MSVRLRNWRQHLRPVNTNGTQRGESCRLWALHFEFNDQGKWLTTLEEIKATANENVRNAIKLRFENIHASAIQKRLFDLEDLDAQISNLIVNYDAKIANKLAHLTEQAAIARQLGIASQSNGQQPERYQSPNIQDSEILGNLSNTGAMQPLYLQGYIALENTIEIIKSRQDKRQFIEEMLPLEQKKLARLKDQKPECAELLFTKTPVMQSDVF